MSRYPTRQMIAGLSTMLGPPALLLGWAVLLWRAGQGPDTGWFVSHALLLSGVVLLVPAVLELRQRLPATRAGWGDLSVGVVLLGALALAGQFAIDLAIGQLAVDQADMSALFRQVAASPGITLTFHVAGPIAFYSGLMLLVLLLFRSGAIPLWATVLATAGIIGIGSGAMIGYPIIALLGFSGLSGGLFPIGWNMVMGRG